MSYVPGDKLEQAPCEQCRAFTPATFSYGIVRLNDGTIVDSVLRATCDRCGTVVATTPESAPVFRQAIEARGEAAMAWWLAPTPIEREPGRRGNFSWARWAQEKSGLRVALLTAGHQ